MKKIRYIVVFFACILLYHTASAQITIEMKREGNVYIIPGTVNGLDMNFVFDTGASDVYLSLTEAIFMLKHGYLVESDIQGVSYSKIANGAIVENTDVILREMEIAGIKIKNVKASISHSTSAPLLLGLSAIEKLGPIQLDGNKLIIQNEKNFKSNEKAIECYYRGFQLIEAGQYENAITILQEGLKYGIDSVIRSNLHQELSAAYYNLGQYDIAIKYCHNGLGDNPYNQMLCYNLGVLLYEVRDFTQSEKAFKELINKFKNKDNVDIVILSSSYAYLGDIQLSKGEIMNAISSYNESLSIKTNSQAYLGLGDAYREQGNYIKSMENYEKGINYEPKRLSNIKRYYQLGHVSAEAGNIDKSKWAFNKSIATYRDNYVNIAEIMQSQDDSAKELATELMWSAMQSYLWLGRIATSPYERVMAYNKALDGGVLKSAFYPMDYVLFSIACEDMGNIQEARAIINEAYSMYPNDINILFQKSQLHEDDETETLELLKRILDFEYIAQPNIFDYATVYNNIAWYYYLHGEFDKGLQYAEKAILRNTNNHDYIWETLGELYFNTGEYEGCINAMSKCIEYSVSDQMKKTALSFRGQAYIKLGNSKEGKADLKSAGNL